MPCHDNYPHPEDERARSEANIARRERDDIMDLLCKVGRATYAREPIPYAVLNWWAAHLKRDELRGEPWKGACPLPLPPTQAAKEILFAPHPIQVRVSTPPDLLKRRAVCECTGQLWFVNKNLGPDEDGYTSLTCAKCGFNRQFHKPDFEKVARSLCAMDAVDKKVAKKIAKKKPTKRKKR